MSSQNGSRPIERDFIQVEGARLYVEQTGTGAPLVFIHRGQMDQRQWDDQVDAFADDFRVIRYDLRGSGQSTMEPGDYSHHVDLKALFDALELEKAALVGLSLGASVAVDFTLEYPERVSSLVLVSPTVGGFTGMTVGTRKYQHDLVIDIAKMDPEETVELSLKMWVDGPKRQPEEVPPDVRDRVRAIMIEAVSKPLQSYLPTMLEPLAITRLGEIRTPTLILTGGRDVHDTNEIALILAMNIPRAKVDKIADSGHLINMEQPERFNAILRRYLTTGKV